MSRSLDKDARIEARFRGRIGGFDLDAEFDAPMRGVTALFGPSGCGKTTVLRCLAGLERFDGRLAIGGEIWQDDATGVFRKPHERPVGYVFQEASLFPHLSVRDNLLFGRRRAERRETCGGLDLNEDEVIDLLGLPALLDRAPDALSGGERQRVAIGRALLSRPRLLLMDEPISALDRMAKDEILPYLDALNERLAIPILYVSHDVAEVARLADRVALFTRGRTVAVGPVAEIFERLDLHPATGRFEAGAVLTAAVARHDAEDGLTYLTLGAQELAIPTVDAPIGETLRLRVRARDVALATRRPEGISTRNILPGTLLEIRTAPGSAFAETLIETGEARLRARITRAAVRELGLSEGARVYALIKTISFDGRSVGHTAPPRA